MDLQRLITKAEHLISQGLTQEEVEKRLFPLIKNADDKKLLARKIFDYSFEYQTRSEFKNQLKWKIGAGLFASLVGVLTMTFFLVVGKVIVILITSGLFYAYINYKKLKLPAEAFRERTIIKKKEERRF